MLPEEVQVLMDKAKIVITPHQAEDFQQLLVNYSDVFSTKYEPLRQSDVIQFNIQPTGEPVLGGVGEGQHLRQSTLLRSLQFGHCMSLFTVAGEHIYNYD